MDVDPWKGHSLTLFDIYLFSAPREESNLAGDALEVDLVYPGLQATSCQAFWVIRRGHVQGASGFQDGCGTSRELPLRFPAAPL